MLVIDGRVAAVASAKPKKYIKRPAPKPSKPIPEIIVQNLRCMSKPSTSTYGYFIIYSGNLSMQHSDARLLGSLPVSIKFFSLIFGGGTASLVVVKEDKRKASEDVSEEEFEIEVDEVEPDDGEDEILDENTVIISKDKKGDVIVEEIEEEVIVVPKKTVTKKKLTKKKVVAKKKVSKPKSKKKVKTIQPTGEIRPPKTVMDAEIELDSMGKPLVDKPSDTLQSLIDEISGDDIGFVDKEQTIQRLKSRMG